MKRIIKKQEKIVKTRKTNRGKTKKLGKYYLRNVHSAVGFRDTLFEICPIQ